MARWRTATRDEVRLACRDFGGDGPPVLLLHGLAGHAEEWVQTASWLTQRSHVLALDARGHGRSERCPSDVSRDAQVDDAAFVAERFGFGPIVVVGQSVGGLTALSLAARRPELVRGLVVADASPEGGGDGVDSEVDAIGAALNSWPVPFRTPADARAFFAQRFGATVAADAWTHGLERRGDGWWPRFDVEVMVRTLRAAIERPSWDEWEQISCPTLVLRAGNGLLEPRVAQEMVRRLPTAHLVELPGAAHDLHLDRPDEWRAALTGFLDSLDAT